MAKNFASKLRILLFSSISLILLLAFQNCGQVNAGRFLAAAAAPTPTIAQNDPPPVADPEEEPADDTGDNDGGTNPEPFTNSVSSLINVKDTPECFQVSSVGESERGQIVHLKLLSAKSALVFATDGKLIIDEGAAILNIPVSSIDQESGLLEFEIPKGASGSSITGSFASKNYNVLIGECN
jgi:hypothetical protein